MAPGRPLASLTNVTSATAKPVDPHGYAAKEIRRRSLLNSPKPSAAAPASKPNTPSTQQKTASSSRRTPPPASAQGGAGGKKVEYVTPADGGGALPPPSPQQLLTLPPPPPRYEPLKRLSYALPPNMAKATRPPAPPSPDDEATADEAAASSDVASGNASAESDRGTAPASPGVADSETVTLDRSDFRQLVVALRNLREQRTSDLEQLGCYRDALVDICHIAVQEAPTSQPVTSMIARLQSDGLLPYTARFDVSGTK